MKKIISLLLILSSLHVFAQCWQSVGAGTNQNFAIKADGTLWGWGRNTYGQLGLGSGSLANVTHPVQIGTDTNWQTVMSGSNHAIALKNDGTLWAWGSMLMAN